jgi:hypothetical protein
LAAYAEKHGASILSRDKDFFRYRNATYTVYNDFKVENDFLHLKRRDFVLVSVSPRTLMLDPLPMTYDALPTIPRILKTLEYYKGCVSPLTKIFGNIFKVIEPLRK